MYKRVRDLREDHDLLQKDVAAYLHCSSTAYAHYETGIRNMPVEVLIKLAQFYGVSIDYMVGLTDVKQPYPPAKKIPRG
ncbi:MAG TPA: helix-turn-helix transcriptional regulator [Candidatus Avidehalobacter gallistercoris]|uniref:Helix-turn-helix transcriptional regulator n=1 Tax=Candidatus Avidehalobacter gallistercoris TaxID=2840694 RepID=A0A9D1HKE8_9FIRM|nr:helix-turn-helix transcriptional regulator [Candidatus Avidehalobacter gallistercoris]